MTKNTILTTIILTFSVLPQYAQNGSAIQSKANSCVSGLVLTAPFAIDQQFIASGGMGDAMQGKQYVQMGSVAGENARPGGNTSMVTKIQYNKSGSVGWAGFYWLWPANNWGEAPVKQIRGASKITFWAAGKNGGEIVQFKAGGITDKQCRDSFEVSLGKVALTKVWKPYEIPLPKGTLQVVGAFAWTAESAENSGGLTFYIDKIRYE